MVSKLKRPHTEWEKIFSSYTSDKGPIETREPFQRKKSTWLKTHEKHLWPSSRILGERTLIQ
jgi:hypothetical protein